MHEATNRTKTRRTQAFAQTSLSFGAAIEPPSLALLPLVKFSTSRSLQFILEITLTHRANAVSPRTVTRAIASNPVQMLTLNLTERCGTSAKAVAAPRNKGEQRATEIMPRATRSGQDSLRRWVQKLYSPTVIGVLTAAASSAAIPLRLT